MRYLEDLGVLHPRLVAAHGVQVDADDRGVLARRGVHVVLCPRSNRNLGVGTADVPALLAAGVRLALGTDSLASVETLDVLDDAVLLHRQFPALDPAVDRAHRDARRRRGARPRAPRDDRTGAGGRAGVRCGRRGARGAARVPAVRRGAAVPRGGRSRLSTAVARTAAYGRMIRFSHSVFALPFALASASLAARVSGMSGRQVLWIVVAMVSARSAAMGFNRLVDRAIDARNPRTASRELPAGVLSAREVVLFVALSTAVFVLAAAMLNPLCLALSPGRPRHRLRLLVHEALHRRVPPRPRPLALGRARRRVARDHAAGSSRCRWCSPGPSSSGSPGFDTIYACQDVELRPRGGPALDSRRASASPARSSSPARCTSPRSLLLASIFWLAPLHPVYLAGVAGVAAILAWEHTLVRPDDLSRVMQAFNLNGWVSLGYFASTALAVVARP